MGNTKVTLSIENELKKLFNQHVKSLKMSVETALKIGGLLHKKKEDLGHGHFTPWLEENLPILMPGMSGRTARNYMQLFKEQKIIKLARVSNLTEAYRLLEVQKKSKSRRSSYSSRSSVPTKKKDRTKKPRSQWDFNDYNTELLEELKGVTSLLSKYMELINNYRDIHRKVPEVWLQKNVNIKNYINGLGPMMKSGMKDWDKTLPVEKVDPTAELLDPFGEEEEKEIEETPERVAVGV